MLSYVLGNETIILLELILRDSIILNVN